MAFELRDYQRECVLAILGHYDKGGQSQLVQLPTGAGKTVILWEVLNLYGRKALIIAPTRELTEQIEETGQSMVGISQVYRKNKSFWPKNKKYLIMTGQAATFAMKGDELDKFDPEFVVIDEAHRARSKSIETLIDHFKERKAKVLGLTATPERLDGKSLIGVFDDVTYSVTLIDLIKEGYLVDLECYRIKTKHKIEEIKYREGDLAASVLKQLDVDSRNRIILDVYKNRCPGKKTLVFCLNVDHANRMAQHFVDNGVRASSIHGGMSQTMRRTILQLFKEGKLDVLCNCQLLTEGFDEPSIEALILARPTKSKALYCQMIGRGVRPFENKNKCLVYDLSDEIHNIQNFNVLGGSGMSRDFEWRDGERLTNAVERNKLSMDEVDYDFEEFALYEKNDVDTVWAHRHQKEIMDLHGIPYLNDITMSEAAYLIFKNQMMRENGICTKNYWEKWRDLEMLRKN